MDPSTLPLPETGDLTALGVWVALTLVIPFLVDLLTNAKAAARLKFSVFTLLNLVSGVLQGFLQAPADEVFDWKTAIWGALISFLVSQAVFKATKGADVTGANGLLADKGLSIGTDVVSETSKVIGELPSNDQVVTDQVTGVNNTKES